MLKDFWAMIFPEFCVACQTPVVKGEGQVCTNCRYSLPFADYHLHPENEFTQKLATKLPLKYGLAYLKFTKSSRVQRILHALKYEGNQEIGELLGYWYGNILKESQFEGVFDVIIPVPLHPSKLRKRGYNQSDCIAKGLSEGLGVKWSSEILVRTKATESQTKKSRMERWFNVSQIFAVTKPQLIDNQHILLIDDVVTTGATLEACWQALENAGAKSVSVMALAAAQ
jgi:ComF family protein